eukprot:5086849-Amphidinium_carterae.4
MGVISRSGGKQGRRQRQREILHQLLNLQMLKATVKLVHDENVPHVANQELRAGAGNFGRAQGPRLLVQDHAVA